jgi:hypothetical protein
MRGKQLHSTTETTQIVLVDTPFVQVFLACNRSIRSWGIGFLATSDTRPSVGDGCMARHSVECERRQSTPIKRIGASVTPILAAAACRPARLRKEEGATERVGARRGREVVKVDRDESGAIVPRMRRQTNHLGTVRVVKRLYPATSIFPVA